MIVFRTFQFLKNQTNYWGVGEGWVLIAEGGGGGGGEDAKKLIT